MCRVPRGSSSTGINRLGASCGDFQIRGDTRLDAGQIREAAAVQRQFAHGPLIDQRGDCRIRCLHQWRLAGDRDFVGNRSDLKREIHDGFPANRQRDAAPDNRFKTRHLRGYLIAAQGQFRRAVSSTLIGFDCATAFGQMSNEAIAISRAGITAFMETRVSN